MSSFERECLQLVPPVSRVTGGLLYRQGSTDIVDFDEHQAVVAVSDGPDEALVTFHDFDKPTARRLRCACSPHVLRARCSHAGAAVFAVARFLEEIEQGLEGHKSIVFSQFTSLLDLLEPRLAERKLEFDRLDGTTTKREHHVKRFQEDPKCSVFLVSIKAGGFGLNLTAASYVFVLDPWWNPAVEMQAIDRAHRIGQKRTVHAMRLVCRGTVEERVLELQSRKRALCEAILGNERSLLQDLTREDLDLLLG